MAKRRASSRITRDVSESDNEPDVYNVEKIVRKRTDPNGKSYYLIKWEGYPSSQNTWEAEDNVFADDLLKEFEANEAQKSSQTADDFTPMKSPQKAPASPRRSPFKKQPPQVASVKTVTRDSISGELTVHFIMSDGSVTTMPAKIANLEYPQIIISFYESRIKFKDTPKH